MRLGTVTWQTSSLSICDSSVNVKDVVRLAPYYSDDPERPMLAEWMDYDLQGTPSFVRQHCPRLDASFHFVGADGSDRQLSLAEIVDFVAKRQAVH
jgi:hypothetical protein